MITLKNGTDTVTIPDKWGELTPDQFIKVVKLYHEMVQGEANVLHFRLRLLKLLSGYERSTVGTDGETAETIDSNLLILSQMLTFAIKPVYANPEVMEVFTEDLQMLLKSRFPFDITEIDHTAVLEMVHDQLKWFPVLDLNFGTNPLPIIHLKVKRGGKVIDLQRFGPTFNIDKYGIISTDMIAEEYVDAMEYFRLYQFTDDIGYLDKMISVLYREKRHDYNTFRDSMPGEVATITICTKLAIAKVFEYICSSITNHPAFEVLFAAKEARSGGSFSDVFYHLSEKGLGSRTDIARWNLTDFFSAMARDIKNSVASLRSSGVDESKISNDLNIPFEILQKI
jgi:hypothetical protein